MDWIKTSNSAKYDIKHSLIVTFIEILIFTREIKSKYFTLILFNVNLIIIGQSGAPQLMGPPPLEGSCDLEQCYFIKIIDNVDVNVFNS